MDRIVIAAATKKELYPFLTCSGMEVGQWQSLYGHAVYVGITGVGVVSATFEIQRIIREERPDLIIQAGIAGAYDTQILPVGKTVEVVRETLADLGVQTSDGFKPFFPEHRTITNSDLLTKTLHHAEGLTVNTACGSAMPEKKCREELRLPVVESMEGYALFYVARRMGIRFSEIRTVSNEVSTDRGSWNFPLAVEQLSMSLIKIFKELVNQE